jgi:hypothetical protein
MYNVLRDILQESTSSLRAKNNPRNTVCPWENKDGVSLLSVEKDEERAWIFSKKRDTNLH